MKHLMVLTIALLIASSATAQHSKTPVSIGHSGKDQVGSLLIEAFDREIGRSHTYERMSEKEKGFRFYVDFVTVDASNKPTEEGKRSVVSVVIQEMGGSDSFPVPDMWYHKVITVTRSHVNATAIDLLEDISARWCNYIKNSVGGCPNEKFEPKLSVPNA
jgi:hypothetical protein